jgi:isopentenyl-diphosphate Delta-isomerase
MEYVVLVNKNNKRIGLFSKSKVHTKNTPLHRGFSLFLINSKNQLLLTKRAMHKKTFPGVWTNAVCGHPGPGEQVIGAARRRLIKELGYVHSQVHSLRVLSPYQYRFADIHGIVENEICPILVALSECDPHPDPLESDDWKWMGWSDFMNDVKRNPNIYSPWSKEESVIVNKMLFDKN